MLNQRLIGWLFLLNCPNMMYPCLKLVPTSLIKSRMQRVSIN